MECESPLNQGFLLRFPCPPPPLFLFTGLRWRHLRQFDMEKSLCNLAVTPGQPPPRHLCSLAAQTQVGWGHVRAAQMRVWSPDPGSGPFKGKI